MSKMYTRKKVVSGRGPKYRRAVLAAITAVVLLSVGTAVYFMGRAASNVSAYKDKLDLLAAQILTEETRTALGKSPAGGQAGHAVFLSICNTAERARVFCGTGADLDAAWENADGQVTEFLANSNYDPVWVKADVVCKSNVLDGGELAAAVGKTRSGFYRYGIAFDPMFGTALLEAELNGAKIYDYDNGGLDFEYLNSYLRKSGRSGMDTLPDAYLMFQCLGWFCDETDAVYELIHDGPSYGRRKSPLVDDAYAKRLMESAGRHLVSQINPDGSFVYGLYPRFDKNVSGYDIVRHAGAIWALANMYRLTGDPKLPEQAASTIEYLLKSLTYADSRTAYILKGKKDEIELGASGLAIIALTEYMDATGDDSYLDVCRDLGNGIIALQDQDTGEFYHVLNTDFSRKEKFRVIYYDGESTFGLCRMYGMTGERMWLDAARLAVDHFIEADYTEHRDHWVAYSMNEITKYVDDPDYYAFGLRNAQINLEQIGKTTTTYHTHLELLMATFELYMRALERGVRVDYLEDGFQLDQFLKTVNIRTDRMLDGYFYPEYAMYMANPQRILNTFMVRHDGYRVRIDDVQHNIGGFYLYYKNYDKLVDCGLLEHIP